jgi:hypothetical protein
MSQALSPFVVDRGSINGHDNYQGSRDLSQQQQQQQLTAPLMLMMQVLQEMLKLMQCMREEVMLRLPKKRLLEEEEGGEEDEEPKERKKNKKPKLMKKVEGDVQCRVLNYELVLISTFLMTRVGLESVCMLEFNKT